MKSEEAPPLKGRPRMGRRLAVGLTGVLIVATVVSVLLVAIPDLFRAGARPIINLRDVSTSNNRLSCDTVPPAPPQSFNFSFLLLNMGDVDGYASVSFVLDGTAVAHMRYLVRAHGIIGKDVTYTVADCGLHDAGVVLASVEGA